MDEPNPWRHMSTAPKDGSRILVTTRPVEQGPADVDMVFWASGDASGMEGWRAADSDPGCMVGYAEPELKCWMPVPQADLADGSDANPTPFEGNEIDLAG